MDSIKKYILNFRKQYANLDLTKNLLNCISYILIISLFFILIEQIFYLSAINRQNLVVFLFTLSCFSLFYIFFIWLVKYNGLLNLYTDEHVAKKIGNENTIIKDKLINTIQLNEKKSNSDLINLAIQNIKNIIDKNPILSFKTIIPYRYLYIFSLITSIFILFFLSKDYRQSLNRIINYKVEFKPPTPFYLENISKKNYALSGDTIGIDFKVMGEIPDSLNLFWIINDKLTKKTVAQSNGIYSYRFNNIQKSLTYWASYDKVSYFSAWDSIGTIPKKINVKQRPKLIKNTFNVKHPDYTKLDDILYINNQETQIEVVGNSYIEFEFEADKDLSKSWMLINDSRIDLEIDKNKIYGDFLLTEDTNVRIYCLDEDLTPNLNPIQYTFQYLEDYEPVVIINSPEFDFEIDESFKISLSANINDDYGIEKIWIEYKTISPGFIDDKPNSEGKLTEFFKKNSKEININYNWDIDDFGLLMGDEIHFWFLAKDNNPYNLEPSKSRKFIGRLPTFEDIFTEINNYEAESSNWIEDIKDTINEISDITENAELELLKEDNISFENQKNIEESLSKIENINNEIEKIQNNIDKILEKAEQNNAFDQSLIEKFNEFQEILNNIMTPELQEAMAQLQEALANMNPEDLSKALENFEFNLEEFENQLDRFMDMFKLAQAEQMLNELTKSIENIIHQQNNLVDDITNNSDDKNQLNKKATKQESRFENFKELIIQTKNITNDFSKNISNKLDSLSNSNDVKESSQSLSETTDQINKDNLQEAEKNSSMCLNSLNKISENINDIKDEFLNESIDEIKNQFISIINDIITISNQQENLIYESKGIRSNSPKILILNENQNNIRRELNQLMEQLIMLSNKTFHITPAINRAFGEASSNIHNVISNFEQKKINNATKSQIQALSNMNLITELLLKALNEMQESNSPSGVEQFMESMENLSQQQQGINQATMQLSQLGMMQQQNILDGLKSQQQKLKEQLEDMLGDLPGQNNGSMEKILNDMEETINDFENQNITRETIQRQQRILSRMLDNQKSLTQKDYSNQKESKTGQNFEYLGSHQLPENLGDKNLLLINAMESAMDEGYSVEYNKIIRNYFLNLQKENNDE